MNLADKLNARLQNNSTDTLKLTRTLSPDGNAKTDTTQKPLANSTMTCWAP